MNCGGTGLVGYSDSSEEESGGGEGKDEDDKSPPRKKHRGGSDSRCAPFCCKSKLFSTWIKKIDPTS